VLHFDHHITAINQLRTVDLIAEYENGSETIESNLLAAQCAVGKMWSSRRQTVARHDTRFSEHSIGSDEVYSFMDIECAAVHDVSKEKQLKE
jgi:hypothetical protein